MQHAARVSSEQLQGHGLAVLASVNPELRLQLGGLLYSDSDGLGEPISSDDGDGMPMNWEEAQARHDVILAQDEDDEFDDEEEDDEFDDEEEDWDEDDEKDQLDD
ncbi:MAG TPA: hypothetical protein VD862_03850 [Candidatus Paceibacterota bacterium]|nr:hypothetical protein [Candidatus Paceibacterota bacterium]